MVGPTFLLVGVAAYSNRGCEAIVRGTVDLLTQRFPHARFIISSSAESDAVDGRAEEDPRIEHRAPRAEATAGIRRFSPRWWTHRVLLRPFPRFTYRHMHSVQLEAMAEADCALEVGGDMYSLDYGAPDWLLELDRVLFSTGKPLVLWGASVGPFSANPDVLRKMRRHLKRFTRILARETETFAYLSSLGIERNVRLVADPAFLMEPRRPALDDGLARFIEAGPIGVNLSFFAGRFRRSGNETSWLDMARALIAGLARSNPGPILLVPHVFIPEEGDHIFLSRVAEGLGAWGERIAILPDTLSASELKWAISRTRVFVGARTHSTIAALSSGVPTLSIAYSLKARGINKDIFGHFDWYLPVTELTPAVLIEKVSRLLEREEEVRGQLAETIPRIQEKSRAAADCLAEVMGR
ncbi:MAG: polysaccharide pyruvyl transferase family protein [Planctomycetes bacterium]|nr:polysaccharide pyruvyl transferase family protein [Planctomycetota bacterium]